jgi:autotransporter-associated beta strand protein
MSIRDYLQGVRKVARRGRTARRREKELMQRRQRFVRLALERLEDRTLLSPTVAITYDTVHATEGQPFSGVVASFVPIGNTSATASDFTATINWGQSLAATAGTVTANSNGGFNISVSPSSGSPPSGYADEGTFQITASIQENVNGSFVPAALSYTQNTVESYNTSSKSWSPAASMLAPRSDFGLVTALTGNVYDIYAIGGFDANGIISQSVEQYNPLNNTWSTMANMPDQRSGFGIAVGHNNIIYVIGGRDSSGNVLNTVESFDPNANQWSTTASVNGVQDTYAPMPTARYDLAATTDSDGDILAIGGKAPDLPTNTVEAFNPNGTTTTSQGIVEAGQWTIAAGMADGSIVLPRFDLSAVTSGLDDFAVGGLNGSFNQPNNSLLLYTSSHNSWAVLPPVPTAAYSGTVATPLGTAVIGPDGNLYVFGVPGTNPSTPLEQFNLSNDTWSTATSLPTSATGLATASSYGSVYAMGGLAPNVGLVAVDQDAPVAITTVTPPSATVGVPLNNVQVATFTDANPLATADDFLNSSIDWGDGQVTGNINQPLNIVETSGGAGASQSVWAVFGTHTYVEAATGLHFSVNIVDDGGATASQSTTINVATNPAAPTLSGLMTFKAYEGQVELGATGTADLMEPIATFSSPLPNLTASDFAATVTWGDNTSSTTATSQVIILAGTMPGNPNFNETQQPSSSNDPFTGPGFTVLGQHLYGEETDAGTAKTITVTITGNFPGSIQVVSQAVINDAPLVALVNGQLALGNNVASVPSVSGTEGSTIINFNQEFADWADTFSETSDMSAVINWGDGSGTQQASISGPVSDPGDLANDIPASEDYTVTGGAGHKYAEAGIYNINVTVTDTQNKGAPPIQNAPALAANGNYAPNSTIYYVITAVTAQGETAASNEESIITAKGMQTVILSWDPVANATGYNIYRRTAQGKEDVLMGSVSGSTLTFTDTGVGGTVHSPPAGNQLVFNQIAKIADAPISLKPALTIGSESQLEGVITAPTQNAADLVDLATPGDLALNQTYYYVITYVNEFGITGFPSNGGTTQTESFASNEVAVTPITAGFQTAWLSWTPVPGATSYNIYRGTSPGGENELVGQITGGTVFYDSGSSIQSKTPPFQVLATFIDPNPLGKASDFTASVNWEDGTTTKNPVTLVGPVTGGLEYQITGTHLYTEAGLFRNTIKVHDKGGEDLQADFGALVKDQQITPFSVSNFNAFCQVPTTQTFQFVDSNPFVNINDLTFTIAWGDGQTTVLNSKNESPTNGTIEVEQQLAKLQTLITITVPHKYANATPLSTPNTVTITVADGSGPYSVSYPFSVQATVEQPQGVFETFSNFLQNLNQQLDQSIFSNPVPLVGTGLEGVADGLFQKIENQYVNSVPNGLTCDSFTAPQPTVQSILFNTFGPNGGLGYLQDSDTLNGIPDGDNSESTTSHETNTNIDMDDVVVNANSSSLDFLMNLQGSYTTPVGFNFGLPGIPFTTSDTSSILVTLKFTMNMAFTITTNGVSFDSSFTSAHGTASSIKNVITFDVSAAGNTESSNVPNAAVQIDGKLGYIPVTLKDQGSSFDGHYNIPITSSPNPTTGNLDISLLNPTLQSQNSSGAYAAAKEQFQVQPFLSLPPDLPSIGSTISVSWAIGNPNPPAGVADNNNPENGALGEIPIVKFESATIDVGTMLGQLGPLVHYVQDVTKPLGSLADFLLEPVPVLDQIYHAAQPQSSTGAQPSSDGHFTFADLIADAAKVLGLTDSTNPGKSFTDDLKDFAKVIKDINKLTVFGSQYNGVFFNLGSTFYVSGDVTQDNGSTPSDTSGLTQISGSSSTDYFVGSNGTANDPRQGRTSSSNLTIYDPNKSSDQSNTQTQESSGGSGSNSSTVANFFNQVDYSFNEFNKATKDHMIDFPILQDPGQALLLYLKQNPTIIKFNIPQFDLNFNDPSIVDFPIPTPIPGLAVNIGFGLNFALQIPSPGQTMSIGYDTSGFASGNFLDGLKFNDVGIGLSVGLTGTVGLSALIVSVQAHANLTVNIPITLHNDTGSTSVSASDFAAGNINIAVNPQVSLGASLELDLGPCPFCADVFNLPLPAVSVPLPSFTIGESGGNTSDIHLFNILNRTTPEKIQWTGGGSTDDWSNPNNWHDVNGNPTAPITGDDLVFSSGASQLTNTDDITGLTVNSITFAGSGYNISGNSITVVNGITQSITSGSDTFADPLVFQPSSTSTNSSITVTNSGTELILTGDITDGGVAPFNALTVGGSGTTDIRGAISGPGGLIKNGTGTLILESSFIGYQGATSINDGILEVSSGANMAPGDQITIAPGATLFDEGTLIVPAASGILPGGLIDTGLLEVTGTLDVLGTLSVGNLPSGQTVPVTGTFVVFGNGQVIVDGAFDEVAGQVTVYPSGSILFENAGQGNVSFGTTFDDEGTVTINSTATFSNQGSFLVANGSPTAQLVVNGTWNGPLEVNSGGDVTGSGPIDGGLIVLGANFTSNTFTINTPAGSPSGFWQLLVNGQQEYAGFADFLTGGIILQENAANDTVNLENVYSGQAIDAVTVEEGSGTDTVFLSPAAQLLANIQGDISIQGGGGLDTVIVDDQNTSANETFTVTNGTINRSGIPISYNGQSLVVLHGGSGNDTYNVLSTSATTNIIGGAASTINVSNNGSVQGIQGVLNLENPAAPNTLIVNDTNDTTFRTATLSTLTSNPSDSQSNGDPWGSITGLAPAAINYEYADTHTLTINGGADGDTINVQAANVTTNLTTNGFSTINVGNNGSVQSIVAALNIENPSTHNNIINLNDSADSTFRYLTLENTSSPVSGDADPWGAVFGLAPVAINYEYADTGILTIDGGAGGDTLSVLQTGAAITNYVGGSTSYVYIGSDGSVQGIQGTLNLENPLSYNYIYVYDYYDTAVRYTTLSTLSRNFSDSQGNSDPWGDIAGLAPGRINYEYYDTNDVYIYGSEALGNYFYVADAAVPTTIYGEFGSDYFFVGTNGSSAGLTRNITSSLSLYGGSRGTNDLYLEDNGNSSTTDNASLTSSSVTNNSFDSFFGSDGSLSYGSVAYVFLYPSNAYFFNSSGGQVGSSITVTPKSGMLFEVFGNASFGAPGNSLTVSNANGTVVDHPYSTDSGYFTFQNSSTEIVYYNGIQSPTPIGLLVASTDAGISPEVKVYNAQTGDIKFDLFPFTSSFLGGVRVAVGDLNGDGVPDIIAAEGPGGAGDGDSMIQVFDGLTGKQLSGPLGLFDPFPGFHGGLYVASADLAGSGYPELIVAQGAGGNGLVNIYSSQTGALLGQFQPYGPNYTGGVRVAAGPVVTTSSGQIHVGVVTGEGAGGSPLVDVFDGPGLLQGNDTPAVSFDAFDSKFHGGVFVATGLISGQGKPPAEIVVGEGRSGEPYVSVFNGAGTPLGSFLAFDSTYRGGVRVATADVTGSGRSDIVAVQGPGYDSSPEVRAFDGVSFQQIDDFSAFPSPYHNGMFVAGGGRWGLFNAALQPQSSLLVAQSTSVSGDPAASSTSSDAVLSAFDSAVLGLDLSTLDQMAAASLTARTGPTNNDSNKDMLSSVLTSLTPSNLPSFLAPTVTGLQRKPLTASLLTDDTN